MQLTGARAAHDSYAARAIAQHAPMKSIPFAEATLRHTERRAVLRVIKSGWLTSGRECALFEEEFAHASQCRHACATHSATAALHLALLSLGCTAGDHLFVSPYTFTASAACAVHLGMNIHFIDIIPNGYTIDCEQLRMAVSQVRAVRANRKRACVIMPVHFGGSLCDMRAIRAIADEHACHIVEDAAHGQPLYGEGGACALRGDCVIFSHYVTKPICAAEGGMLITDNDAIARRARILRNHGIDRSLWDRTKHDRSAWWAYEVVDAGYKYTLSDVHAAVGRVQLHRANRHRQQRAAIAARYRSLLEDTPWLSLPRHGSHSSWHLFAPTLRSELLTISRDIFLRKLAAHGICCSVHYRPLHTMRWYQQRCGSQDSDCPRAVQRGRESFSLPIYPHLTRASVNTVGRAVRAIGNQYYRAQKSA